MNTKNGDAVLPVTTATALVKVAMTTAFMIDSFVKKITDLILRNAYSDFFFIENIDLADLYDLYIRIL